MLHEEKIQAVVSKRIREVCKERLWPRDTSNNFFVKRRKLWEYVKPATVGLQAYCDCRLKANFKKDEIK